MTMPNTENQGQKAFQLHANVIKNEQMRRVLLLESMAFIHELHNTGMYKSVLGDENAPWSAYLSQFEVFYSASKVYMFDKIYGKFIKELNLDPIIISQIPLSKLSALVKIVTKENVFEWLNKAESLTSHDFEDEIRKAHGKVSYLECPHSNERAYMICQSCGFKHAPHEERKDESVV